MGEPAGQWATEEQSRPLTPRRTLWLAVFEDALACLAGAAPGQHDQ